MNSKWHFLCCAIIAFSERFNTLGKVGLWYQHVHVTVPTVCKPLDDVCIYEAWYEYYTTRGLHFCCLISYRLGHAGSSSTASDFDLNTDCRDWDCLWFPLVAPGKFDLHLELARGLLLVRNSNSRSSLKHWRPVSLERSYMTSATLPVDTATYPRMLESSSTSLWKNILKLLFSVTD